MSHCYCQEPNPFCRRAGVPMMGRLWELCQHNEAYRASWDGRHTSQRPPCKHLGGVMGSVECESCAGRVHLKVLACTRYGSCTVARPVPGHTCCVTCSDYQPEE